MALGLIVLSEHEELGVAEVEADRFFFFVAGVAALTLILNATTADKVLQYLGLLTDYSSSAKHITMNQVCNRLRTQILKEVEATVQHRHIDTGIHWSDLIQYNTLLQSHEEAITPTPEEAELAAVQHVIEPSPKDSEESDEERVHRRWRGAVKREISLFERRRSEQQIALRQKYVEGHGMYMHCRTMFFSLLRVQYWEFISSGKLPRNNSFATQVLLYSVDVGLEHVNELNSMRDWMYIKSQTIFNRKYNTDELCNTIISCCGDLLPKILLVFAATECPNIAP